MEVRYQIHRKYNCAFYFLFSLVAVKRPQYLRGDIPKQLFPQSRFKVIFHISSVGDKSGLLVGRSELGGLKVIVHVFMGEETS